MAARPRGISTPTPHLETIMSSILDTIDETQVVDGAHHGLRLDFFRACTDLADARRRQQAKDTPAHRNAVLDSRARVDAVLDLYLEAGRIG